MKYFFLSLLLIGVAFLVVYTHTALATSPKVILSEIQVAGEKSDDEFIELYNTGMEPFDLSSFQLRRRTQSGSESSIKVFGKDSVIPPHGYFLWGNSKGLFASPTADTETSSSPLADNNSVALFTKSGISGVLVDSMTWGSGSPFSPEAEVFSNPSKNTSLTRSTETLTWSLSLQPTPRNSQWKPEEETPSEPEEEPESPPDTEIPPTPQTPKLVRLNEILPNPKEKGEQNEFIELYNAGEETVSIAGFSIRDASKTGKYTFPDDTSIEGKGFLVILRTISKLSLNNSTETLTLFDDEENEVGTVRYEKTKEDVSLNYGTEKWRGGKPTPGKPNEINNLPEVTEKVPKKGYRDIAVSFNATGKDIDGDTLKYTWDFGDDHKSYKAKTSHTYKEKGSYHVTLTISDGNEDTVETFSIKIESFPTPDVRITALLPNPSGVDSENEWIAIENRGKKSVNLKGFSIATGWKKLINHPIREDFILDPKEERRLTREYFLFTLPNQKGKIELRTPNKKVLQKIKYKLEKSVAEDVVYNKEKGKRWEWEEDKTAKEEDSLFREESPLIEEAPLEEPLPDTEKGAGEKVLGVETQEETPRQSGYITLLNYGTNITLPEDIILTFSEDFPDNANVSPDSVDYSPSGTFLQKVNSYLNALQNRG